MIINKNQLIYFSVSVLFSLLIAGYHNDTD